MYKINYLINKLKYARKLHLVELTFRIKEQKNAIKEKDFVIKFLDHCYKEHNARELKKAKNILKKWQKNHYFWIDLVKGNKSWAKKGGSVSWHKKWIKIYQSILDSIE